MAEKKKVGRPMDNPKGRLIRVRPDAEADVILEAYCVRENVTRAGVVRCGISLLNKQNRIGEKKDAVTPSFCVTGRMMRVPNRSAFRIDYSRFFTTSGIEEARIYAVFDTNAYFLKELMTGIESMTSALPIRRTTDCVASASCHKAYVE